MKDDSIYPAEPRLLLTYDPLSPCDADPEAKARQILVDAVVAHVHDGGTCPSYEVEDLAESEDSIYCGDVDWFCPVTLSMAEEELSDFYLREYQGLGDEVPVTDAMRLKHGLRVIEDLLNDCLEGDQPATSAIEIVDYRSRSCLIAYELKGYSFSGVECRTIGAFKDEQEMHLWYRRNGYMISQDDLVGAEAKILASWDDYHPHSSVDPNPYANQENVVDMLLWKLSRNAWKSISEKYPDRADLYAALQDTLQSTGEEVSSHE